MGNGLADRYHSSPAAEPAPAPAPGPVPAPGPAADPTASPTVPVVGPAAAPAVPPRHAPAPPMPVPETRLAGGHYSSRIGRYGNGRTIFRDCFVCTARPAREPNVARRRQTPNSCEKCGKSLCVDKLAWGKVKTCFQLYHTVKNYV